VDGLRPDRPFEIRIEVRDEDIDAQGHVNNVVYVRWIQEAAIAHWRDLAPAVDQAAVGWVVTRHEIDYRRAAFREDSIVARTWVGVAERFAFDRHTEIARESDGKVLATARTVWCPVSRETGRPVDVRPELRALFSLVPPVPE
jgi:acyl-CoA thioester hydrolase